MNAVVSLERRQACPLSTHPKDDRMTHIVTCLLLVLAPVAAARAAVPPKPKPVLRAGAAAMDITPKVFPLNTPGGFNARMTTRAHDPLHARAVVLDDGQTAVAMIVVDSLGVAPETIDEAKAIASKATGIPVDRMFVCSTHTHSAPSSNVKDGPAPAVAYRKQLVEGIVASVVEAHKALRPAAVGAAKHPLPEEVFNRRWFLKPGKMPLNPFGKLDQVKMNPGRSAEVLDRPAGPTDPDIMVISVQDTRRKPLALLANYALHYVGAVPKGAVSADYFGEFARLMPSRVRGDEKFVAMMTNGASGDINNIPFLVTRPPREPYEQIRIVARKAADTAWHAWRKIDKHRTDVRLGMVQRDVTLKYRKPSEEDIANARTVLAVKDEAARATLPRLAENYARRTLTAAKRSDTVVVKLQVIRIGDIAVCGIPFETLVEIGLDLKRRSPFTQTMVIALANGRHGYLPTPEQHKLGGYETWLGTSNVQKDASVIVTDNLLGMLKELAD